MPLGKTKFTVGFSENEFYPGSPAVGLRMSVPVTPEVSAYNERVSVSADGQRCSGYGDGRIGWEGQRPNWGLFGTAAPWVFAETIWQRRADGGFDPEIKTSVAASYLPNTREENGHDPFNQIYIYKYVTDDKGSNYVLRGTLEMLGHLKAFIESGDTALPGKPPQPFVQP